MHNESLQKPEDPRQTPWNKGKLIGSKPPLRTKDVWSIRTKLQVEERTRDLAMFNLAIDSKLRGCDVVSLKVEDVAPHGITVDRATVRQRKTGHPVRFELSEQTREAVDEKPHHVGNGRLERAIFKCPLRVGVAGAVQHFDAHAQKSCRLPFIDPSAHQPSRGGMPQCMRGNLARELGQLNSSFKCGLHTLHGSAVPLDEMLARNSFRLPTAEMSQKPRRNRHRGLTLLGCASSDRQAVEDAVVQVNE